MSEDNKNVVDKKWLYMVVFIVILLLFFNIIYFIKIGWSLSSEAKDFEAYGSYIGGALGSIFSFASIIILIITLHHQKQANSSNVKLLRDQLDNQKTSNELSIKLLREELNQTRENYEKTFKYNQINILVESIKTKLFSKIDSSDFYDLFNRNNGLADKLGFKTFSQLNKKEFYEFYDKKIINMAMLLVNIDTAKCKISDLDIDDNILKPMKSIAYNFNRLTYAISDYYKHNVSHNSIVFSIYDIFTYNDILYNIGIYEICSLTTLHKNLDTIFKPSFSNSGVLLSPLIYDEERFILYIIMLNEDIDNLMTNNTEIGEFLNNYIILRSDIENEYIVKHRFDNDFNEIIKID